MEQNNKILLVEDEPFLIRFYQEQLRKRNYDVYLVEDGALAFQAAVDQLPSLILLDVILPNKDGFTILKELKSDDRTKDIPVLTISQLSQESDLSELKRLGAYTCLVKMETQLSDVIEQVVNHLPLSTKTK